MRLSSWYALYRAATALPAMLISPRPIQVTSDKAGPRVSICRDTVCW
jgi:hypothetical protein